MKKLELNKETLRVLSSPEAESPMGGAAPASVIPPSQKPVTLCVPTVCHYRDCEE